MKIVNPEIVSINFPGLIKFGKKSMFDSFKNNLDLNWLDGEMILPIVIWINISINENLARFKIKFFLLIPLIQKIKSSLFFSYLISSKNIEINRTKGKILWTIFGKLNKL